jgi:hypothetical protein
LKSICIQLLSFFSDERIEQEHSHGFHIDVAEYRQNDSVLFDQLEASLGFDLPKDGVHVYKDCGFGVKGAPSVINPTVAARAEEIVAPKGCPIANVPFDVLLEICDRLDTDELVHASKAWSGFLTALHHLVPVRNLQCFTIKKGTKDVNIGIGVHVNDRGGFLSSEFDYVSDVAFKFLGVRRSIQGLPFQYWLPLAINARHWDRVKDKMLYESLGMIQSAMRKTGPSINVIYACMNDVVVKLSDKANDTAQPGSKSTLTHASEKAIESYFALFQLLICMAIEDPTLVTSARKSVTEFMTGKRNKEAVPNIGHFLVARLLSDADQATSQTATQQEGVTIAIIKEAIVRNVVWMLSSHNNKGGNRPELAYLERTEYSAYRLVQTYRAGTTSYRLLMFQDLMRRTVLSTYAGKPLVQIRAELFNSHGMSPDGAATRLAAEIRDIQKVKNFPDFFAAINIKNPPSKERFTDFLRRSIKMSDDAGYSKPALRQSQALYLRKRCEPDVVTEEGAAVEYHHGKVSFFRR